MNAVRPASRLSLLVILSLVTAACTTASPSQSAGPSGSAGAATGGTVRIGWGGSPDSLNPGDGLLEEAYILYELVYDTPIGLDGNGAWTPELATDWSQSDDGLTWTMHLVDNATFHDGTPLTSADVKFTLELYRDTADFPYLPSYCDVCTSIEAPDPTTVLVHISDPIGNFEARMAFMYILPKHIWEGVTDPVAFENKEMIGSGPFKLVESVQNDHTTLTTNTDYWRARPNVDGVIFQTISNPDARVAALTNRDVDMITEFPATAISALKNADNVKVYIADEFPGSVRDVFFNQVKPADCPPAPDGKCTGHPALLDLQVRRALATAMDKQQIIDVTKLGLATPGLTLTTPGLGDYYAPEVKDYAFSTAAANKLLDEAGYKDTDGDGIRECPASVTDCGPTGDLTFRFNYADDIDSAPREAELLKGMWNAIGVDIQIQGLDPDTLTSVCCPAFDYDIMLWGWDSDPDPAFLLGVAICAEVASGFSETGYCNPAYDALYTAQGIERDHAARVELVHQMQQILIDDVVYMIPYYPRNVEAYRTDSFSGWLTGPLTLGLEDPASLTVIRPVQ